MRSVVIICTTLCLISGQGLCFSVIGCSGGSVMFKCLYETNDQHKETYFCREGNCTKGISTNLLNNGRVSLYDDENNRFLKVFIRNLSREDDGKYKCGNKQIHDFTLVVNNKSSSCGTGVIRSAYTGQTISFRCKYNKTFQTHTKVLYRVKGDPVLVLNSSRSSSSSEEKFILTDSQKDHFNVTIRHITADDGGVYLCGVERYRSSQTITHIIFIKETELNVSSQITSVLVKAYNSKSVFIRCQFPQEFKRNKKFFQKYPSQNIPVDQNQWDRRDKVYMYDDTSEGLLKVFISDLTEADEGTYRCLVNTTKDHLFIEFKLKISSADKFSDSRKSAVIGESMNFTCSSPEKHELIKHICKENEEKICERISPSEFSDSTAGVYTASISNVRMRDAGVYWCGEETRHKHLTSVSLTNKHELTLSMPPVIRREGDSAEIKCPYDKEFSTEMCLRIRKCLNKEIKYLCKGKCFTEDAQNIIRSDKDPVKNQKISVKDNTELNLLVVNMTDLRAEDAGKYWCSVKDLFDIHTDLMIIRKDVVSREASVGGSVSVSCKHIRNQNQRFFCRGDQPNVCFRDGVRVSSNQRINGRFSLTEETSAGVLTVNISSLRAEDSGKYWCGEESSGSFIFTEVQLHLTREMTSSNTREESVQETEKSVSSAAAAVSVGLLLLALVIVLILLKLKHNKRGIISSPDRRETAQEDIPDARSPSDSDPESAPLYSTVQSPTIPSDELLYSSVSFQKHEESVGEATVRFSKDETHCDYASVNHSISGHLGERS